MNLTLKLVKYSLGFILYIALCLFLLVVKIHYKTIVETIFVGRNDNSKLSEFNRSAYDFESATFQNFGSVTKNEELHLKFRRIYETCEKYNLTETLIRTHFLYSPKHEALYCWIRKVGSTSFTKFFSDLRHRKVANNYYKEIKFLAPRSIEELKRIINNPRAFKFLVVRHPFQRIVSSYRDRIEDNSRYTAQAWIYVPRIFHLTRPELFHSNKSSGGNGLQHIFDSQRRLKLIPSFDEFVSWLLNEPLENDDVHWHQYHHQCSICIANFDYILNLDNYTLKDVRYIFERLGLDESQAYLPRVQLTRGGKSDFARTCQYIGSLKENLARRLYERYRIDFEMFDYKYEDYVNCTTSRNN